MKRLAVGGRLDEAAFPALRGRDVPAPALLAGLGIVGREPAPAAVATLDPDDGSAVETTGRVLDVEPVARPVTPTITRSSATSGGILKPRRLDPWTGLPPSFSVRPEAVSDSPLLRP